MTGGAFWKQMLSWSLGQEAFVRNPHLGEEGGEAGWRWREEGLA